MESAMNAEVFSGIKVLVALAQADGKIHDDERVAIENALDGEELPGDMTVASLLAAEIDLAAELAQITSAEARKRTYDSACALVYVDGELSKEEEQMLARVRAGLAIETKEHLEQAFKKFTSMTPPSDLAEVEDESEREVVVADEIANAAAFSAILSTTSLPVAAESCLFTNNVRLARNIGLAYGHDADDAFWRTFASNVVGAAASWFAISSLLKLLPKSGNAGAAAYASTFALGKVTELYFEKDEAVEPGALREAFLAAKKEGLKAAQAATAAIAARKEKLEKPKAALDADLAAGTITENAYADKLVALA
jgi:uncharacterized protein (DUF697 family)/uncharacterized tellurite resistance protein B-like protein